jgi:hypothetical protein
MDWKQREQARNIEMFKEAYIDAGFVARWKSNDRCPFPDMLESWHEAGRIGYTILSNTIQARELESAAAIREYVAYRQEHGYSAEERAEMTAAFGEGAEIVDVFTGRKMKL